MYLGTYLLNTSHIVLFFKIKNDKVDAKAAEKLAELRFEKDQERLTKAKEVIKKCQSDGENLTTY